MFVCFKQKTAYEMRISDWSSDVCSSDLRAGAGVRTGVSCRASGAGDGGSSSAARRSRYLSRPRCNIKVIRHFVVTCRGSEGRRDGKEEQGGVTEGRKGIE